MPYEEDETFSEGLKEGTIGYAMRNPPHSRVSENAVAFVQNMPSISELFLTNGSAFEREFSETVELSRKGTLECERVTYGYGIDGDGIVIVSCETDESSLSVPAQIEGMPVRIAGSHSFSTCYNLEHIDLPECIEEIHGYAFMNTALKSFTAPASLRYIGCKAFYKCKYLETVCLNEGLVSIGDLAFRESGLQSARIPSTVLNIGQGVFDGTGIACSGHEGDQGEPQVQGLSVAAGNPRYCLLKGSLYEIGEDGWALIQLVDESAVFYDGSEIGDDHELIYVAERAFADRKHLESVYLPDGVVSIGEAAFRGCTSLTEVRLPETLVSIGLKVFWETALPEINVPASLRVAGTAAFHTGGTVSGARESTVRRVSVSPGNLVFYVANSMLCMCLPDGGVRVLLYTGQDDVEGDVVIPREVTSIGPYAFSNVKGVRSLRLHSDVKTVDISGFDFGSGIPDIYYDDLETGKSYTIQFPAGSHGYTYMRQAFNRGVFNLEEVYELLDRSIMVTRDPFVRARAMLGRLTNPVFATDSVLERYRERLRSMLSRAVVEFGRNGYPQGIDQLMETGVLKEYNIEEAIEAAVDAGEVAVLSRLMEIRRVEFGAALFDFDL